ncbi:cytochrome P450 [Solihabitans fulvus]|uniref:Cytochrome P450 n=1 Tax=Solihabitans fulvus TaxID=1892852 RepID=A0A5B2X5S8_9PSEU|nr:cytochrome P450 [Solihabitans fulvus]KAA2258556.1 cytochrome P450 [Solihabitans fulvus]
MWTTEQRAELDLFGRDFVDDPDPTLRRLREHAPVHHDPRTDLWLVSRHADVRAVLADQDTFQPDNALTAVTPLPIPVLRVLARAGFALPPTLANNGTPSHPGLRRLVAGYLTPGKVADAVGLVEGLAEERLAEVEAALEIDGVADLYSLLATDLPCLVLLHMLGITGVDVPRLKAWSTASLELFWGNPGQQRQLELAAAAGEFHRWLADRVRAADPAGADLFGALVAHRAPGDRPLTVDEAAGLCYFLLIAGQETTTQLLSTLLDRVLRRPELWRRLAEGEQGLAEACVEEVLRREPPVVTWRRITARETVLSGVVLPAGAKVLLMLAGSGSDPEVFAEPSDFCPGRPEVRRHLAFGFGRHFCLGAGLARMEAEAVLRTVARRLPDARLADDGRPPMLGLLSFRAPLRVAIRTT